MIDRRTPETCLSSLAAPAMVTLPVGSDAPSAGAVIVVSGATVSGASLVTLKTTFGFDESTLPAASLRLDL